MKIHSHFGEKKKFWMGSFELLTRWSSNFHSRYSKECEVVLSTLILLSATGFKKKKKKNSTNGRRKKTHTSECKQQKYISGLFPFIFLIFFLFLFLIILYRHKVEKFYKLNLYFSTSMLLLLTIIKSGAHPGWSGSSYLTHTSNNNYLSPQDPAETTVGG